MLTPVLFTNPVIVLTMRRVPVPVQQST